MIILNKTRKFMNTFSDKLLQYFWNDNLLLFKTFFFKTLQRLQRAKIA